MSDENICSGRSGKLITKIVKIFLEGCRDESAKEYICSKTAIGDEGMQQ